ncbi:hypothetical protein [Desulfofarcimen acetoxidans]|uniref:hypothetical protein n=1 Tax=Desulfofarcimen acetoxidans TaxID=58138 RepID=UPI0012FEA54C|nr:hypothetical protein [Desulfofarcimen acetoxidans]
MNQWVKARRRLAASLAAVTVSGRILWAGNWYSHLVVGLRSPSEKHRERFGKLVTPYAANDERSHLLVFIPRDGFSAFTAKIPVLLAKNRCLWCRIIVRHLSCITTFFS